MVKIRKATPEDAQAVWDIRNASILAKCTGYYPDEMLKKWTSGVPSDPFYSGVERDCYLAVDSGDIAGFGMVDLERGRVKAVFVHPHYQGKGVGRMILGYLEGLARDVGLAKLSLASSLNGAAFYRTCGFVGNEIGKYESPKGVTLACVHMSKRLDQI